MRALIIAILVVSVGACGENFAKKPAVATCEQLLEQSKQNHAAIKASGAAQLQAIKDGLKLQADSDDRMAESIKELVRELRTTRGAPVIIERRMVYPRD